MVAVRPLVLFVFFFFLCRHKHCARWWFIPWRTTPFSFLFSFVYAVFLSVKYESSYSYFKQYIILIIQQSNDEKFRQLVKLAHNSPVIHFSSADQYHKLVSEAGRNYSVFVLFTATHSRYKCAPCGYVTNSADCQLNFSFYLPFSPLSFRSLHSMTSINITQLNITIYHNISWRHRALAEEFRQFGVSYEAYFGSDYLHNAEFLSHPLFLAQVEPDQCMDVFQGVSLRSHLPSKSRVFDCSIASLTPNVKMPTVPIYYSAALCTYTRRK